MKYYVKLAVIPKFTYCTKFIVHKYHTNKSFQTIHKKFPFQIHNAKVKEGQKDFSHSDRKEAWPGNKSSVGGEGQRCSGQLCKNLCLSGVKLSKHSPISPETPNIPLYRLNLQKFFSSE